MGELYSALNQAIREKGSVVLLTESKGPNLGAKMLVSEDRTIGSLGNPDLDRVASAEALEMLLHGAIDTRQWGPKGEEGDEVEVFIQSFAPPPL
ncbi:MAG: XdhC family protein, partial [Actinomycetota bacterium]